MSARKMRIVVTGCQGQVASSLVKRGELHQDMEIVTLGRPVIDFADTGLIMDAIVALKPDAIISAAAYTAVDRAESEPDLAERINSVAPREIGRAAAECNVPVIHLSTDYVFDGTKPSPYVESDPTSPLGVYGCSKRKGELAIAEATDNHVILRTAWVYSPFGHNFLKTMLRIAATKERIDVVDDQIGNPTSALDLAEGIISIARSMVERPEAEMRGLFHLVGTGHASWADFAEHILSVSKDEGGPFARIGRIRTIDYPTPAKRPTNSRLSCQKLADIYGICMPDWKVSSADLISKIL
ncbi:dTDP-4-dehydrorhamnose reductase [Agrobacterium pusense]|uniref:dTDP-4-dehydrorhamnose reductase n=1 Tax=Agrobacterium pusense TaxID=648995 RepID=UPI0028581E6A|nr:dTDP-4-dehydrorhamnose reductase [Agrobacterium pusense]MDR6192722.1 dTDP-4-dehydrorhamnose reductase [Agrobacterium pusense]